MSRRAGRRDEGWCRTSGAWVSEGVAAGVLGAEGGRSPPSHRCHAERSPEGSKPSFTTQYCPTFLKALDPLEAK